MSAEIRVLLIVGAFATMAFMLGKIRSAKIQIEYSIFWIVFSVGVVVLSLFPQIAFWAVRVLGMQSPINVVYLAMIFVLFIRLFSMTTKLSQLESKLNKLVQQQAINETERNAEKAGKE